MYQGALRMGLSDIVTQVIIPSTQEVEAVGFLCIWSQSGLHIVSAMSFRATIRSYIYVYNENPWWIHLALFWWLLFQDRSLEIFLLPVRVSSLKKATSPFDSCYFFVGLYLGPVYHGTQRFIHIFITCIWNTNNILKRSHDFENYVGVYGKGRKE